MELWWVFALDIGFVIQLHVFTYLIYDECKSVSLSALIILIFIMFSYENAKDVKFPWSKVL